MLFDCRRQSVSSSSDPSTCANFPHSRSRQRSREIMKMTSPVLPICSVPSDSRYAHLHTYTLILCFDDILHTASIATFCACYCFLCLLIFTDSRERLGNTKMFVYYCRRRRNVIVQSMQNRASRRRSGDSSNEALSIVVAAAARRSRIAATRRADRIAAKAGRVSRA